MMRSWIIQCHYALCTFCINRLRAEDLRGIFLTWTRKEKLVGQILQWDLGAWENKMWKANSKRVSVNWFGISIESANSYYCKYHKEVIKLREIYSSALLWRQYEVEESKQSPHLYKESSYLTTTNFVHLIDSDCRKKSILKSFGFLWKSLCHWPTYTICFICFKGLPCKIYSIDMAMSQSRYTYM